MVELTNEEIDIILDWGDTIDADYGHNPKSLELFLRLNKISVGIDDYIDMI